MESLLRLDESFDVALLDRIVAAFYQGHGPDVRWTRHTDCLIPCSILQPSRSLRKYKSTRMHGKRLTTLLKTLKTTTPRCVPLYASVADRCLVYCPANPREAHADKMECSAARAV